MKLRNRSRWFDFFLFYRWPWQRNRRAHRLAKWLAISPAFRRLDA